MNSGNITISSSTQSRVIVRLLVGHSSEKLSHPTSEGHTHRWTVYVKPTGSIQFSDRSFIRKVVFMLHSSFNNPNRIIKDPPFQVTETGYGGFEMQIKVQFNGVDKTFTFNYDLSLSLVDKYCEFNIEQKMELKDVTPEMYSLVQKYCPKKQDKDVPKEKPLFSKNQFAIKNEKVKNDSNFTPSKAITNDISKDLIAKEKKSSSNIKKSEKPSKKSQAYETSLSLKSIMPEKSIKSSKNTNSSDTSNNTALTSSAKTSKSLKTSESTTNAFHNNKTEPKSAKTEIFNIQKSDEKLNIKEKIKKKVEDEFIDSFFEEPKKSLDNNLVKKKKDKEKSKIKYKNPDKLNKEEKLTEKERTKKVIKMEKSDQLELNKHVESNKSFNNIESVDIKKKSKKNLDKVEKKKSKNSVLLNKIVKEKKLNSIKTELTNVVEKSGKLTAENKSDSGLNKQNFKREFKQLDSEKHSELDISRQKKTKLLNECVKTEPNSPYRSGDNCEKRPHSSISLPPPLLLISSNIGQSPSSINSISVQSVSPLTAQQCVASSTCSDDTAIEMSMKEENIINSIGSSVTEYSAENHETNNNDVEPSTSSSDDMDIDYDSGDNEFFGTPFEKLRRYNLLQKRINSIALAEDELQYRILDTLMTMDKEVIDYDDTLSDVRFKLRFLKRETVLALEEVIHNFEPMNNWLDHARFKWAKKQNKESEW